MRTFALNVLLALIFVTNTAIAAPDLRATTEDGRKVLLSPDGKWRFNSNQLAPYVPSDSSSPYLPPVKKFSLSFNTTEWTLTPKRDGGENNKRQFQHKTLPIYGMVISDVMPANTSVMKEVILGNARQAGTEPLVLLDEIQQIGGKDVGSIRFSVSAKGVEFLFSTYYYADQDGNIQVTCYTAQSLFSKYQSDCEKFLSGLVIK
jgi:hypothetical protein